MTSNTISLPFYILQNKLAGEKKYSEHNRQKEVWYLHTSPAIPNRGFMLESLGKLLNTARAFIYALFKWSRTDPSIDIFRRPVPGLITYYSLIDMGE